MATSTQNKNRGEGGIEAEKHGGVDEMARKRREATIIRAPKDRDHPYKTVRRATIEDPRLSWEERGLLSYLLVKPDDWEISIPALIKVGGAGKNKMYTMIAHLEELRYLERQEIREKGRFVGVRLLLHEIPFPENRETVKDEPYPDFQEMVDTPPLPGIGETVEPSPLPENREMATRVTPFPDLRDPVKPLPVNRTHTNKEYSTNEEQPTNEEEKNERMNESSFIHSSSSTDAQVESDSSFALLTAPEVGLDDTAARALAGAWTFEFIERQVFAWLDHREKGGRYGTTGALIKRIEGIFSTPPLTAEQRRSALYARFHEEAPRGHPVGPYREEDVNKVNALLAEYRRTGQEPDGLDAAVEAAMSNKQEPSS